MGASVWEHFVLYQEDINLALQAVRQTVFVSGEYYKVDHGEWCSMSEEDMCKRLLNMDKKLADIMYSDGIR